MRLVCLSCQVSIRLDESKESSFSYSLFLTSHDLRSQKPSIVKKQKSLPNSSSNLELYLSIANFSRHFDRPSYVEAPFLKLKNIYGWEFGKKPALCLIRAELLLVLYNYYSEKLPLT